LQVVDLQEDKNFQRLGVELLSMSPDSLEAWRKEGRELGIRDFSGVLTDRENEVAESYGVMRWAVGGEPGHTFALVESPGRSPGCKIMARWRTAESCTSFPTRSCG
jgi:hypothetical protein